MTIADDAVAAALRHGGRVEITTTGRHTGLARRVELAFHNVDGRIVLSGRPGFPRSWVANLRSDPHMTFHLRGNADADLQATGRLVVDRAERERLLAPIAASWRIALPLMVASSPLVEVTIDEP